MSCSHQLINEKAYSYNSTHLCSVFIIDDSTMYIRLIMGGHVPMAGEIALQADCGGFDSHTLHMDWMIIAEWIVKLLYNAGLGYLLYKIIAIKEKEEL